METSFKALVVEEHDGAASPSLRDATHDELPAGDVLVAVAYSGLNYKDGLAVLGKNKVIRSFPMVPGIDLAGSVVASDSPNFQPGDQVVSTGWGVGERHWGGYAQMARLKSEWLVPVPPGMSLRDAVAIGTPGVTAMLALMALEAHGLRPDGGDVLVTGASGGVGSMAVALLAHYGYRAVAATGKADAHAYLTALGAREIISREAIAPQGGPLGTARWQGAIDTVGSEMLAGALRTLTYGGSVAACGNAGGFDLHTTVLPFILRGVNLLGIDSLPVPLDVRRTAWARLAEALPHEVLERTTRVARLAEVPALAGEIMQGNMRGHVVIDVNA